MAAEWYFVAWLRHKLLGNKPRKPGLRRDMPAVRSFDHQYPACRLRRSC